ncbi:hypothetical protein CH330_05420 [candidate division WOR-3 bacterium JGI_Cruoil_03_51_56]|uniref:Secretion system C-terminal sorting domain-containing protein n=1 Tax=candidate division WOR-3 bacterium JGI_Cruoil_03_51_56 TaxID=1973747 RepID=A0A235BSR1_UNCW3|nr:MAG: hypothetical protein CH330_05420 [candidate division WOR-3 bacterium JGI_Cruoil_03_51_56]
MAGLVSASNLTSEPGAAETDTAYIGRVDTIGGTTYDWQLNGPALRMVCNSPDHGVHAVWMYSASTQTTFPDRRMRYNFYDYGAGEWNWIDSDYMQSGVNVETERSGYGSLDADSAGLAIVSCHSSTPIHPSVARDMAPGAGIFEYCSGSPVMDDYLWPVIAVGQNQTIHCACLDNASRDLLFYSRVPEWCRWDTAIRIAPPQPGPMFPSHNIAASKVSPNVVITWVDAESAPSPGFYRESSDGGTTWGPPTQLPWPPAFSGDTLPSFHLSSLFPYYDRHDQLHIVAAVISFFHDRLYQMPAEIWHWCSFNLPEWSRIHRAGCDSANLRGIIGYNSLYAGRPSIGEDAYGGLYVAWEQFDSSNVEPETNLLRADIFYARDNYDNGMTWQPAVKITNPGTVSHRFPCVIDYLYADTVCIRYMIDQVAGFFVQNQGPATDNPIVVHKVWVPVGIGSEPLAEVVGFELAARPNPFSGHTRLSYALPSSGRVRLAVYDMTGRQVALLVDRFQAPGRYSVNWHTADLSPGVYVAELKTSSGSTVKKLVVLH